MIRIVFISSLILLRATALVYSQELIKAQGSSQQVLEDDLSKEELKIELLFMAKLDAIEKQFGSIIEQESRVEINEGGTFFNIVGDRYLKGEWLNTTKENFKEEYRKVKSRGKDKMELWISCEIEGWIREMEKPEVAFEFTTTNCPDKLCRTTDFYDGESMLLYFKSPVEGYLSVFSVENENVYRLLPYQQIPADFGPALPVEADKEYLFFSTDDAHNSYTEIPSGFADELIMTTELNEEYLYLYVIFSQNIFNKPGLDYSSSGTRNDLIVPASLKKQEFETWLSENRILSQDFYFKKMRLKISK